MKVDNGSAWTIKTYFSLDKQRYSVNRHILRLASLIHVAQLFNQIYKKDMKCIYLLSLLKCVNTWEQKLSFSLSSLVTLEKIDDLPFDILFNSILVILG